MFFIIIGLFSVPSWWFIAFAIVRDFIPFAAQLRSQTAYSAHLGGYAFGIVVSLILLATKMLPREQYDLFSLAKHRHRRQTFKQAGLIAESHRAKIAADRKLSRAEEEAANRLAEARAAVTERIARGQLDEAAELYRDLLDNHGHDHSASTLNRAHQLTIANHLYRTGDHQLAALAYDRFLESNPDDAESPGVRLLLGLINARFLNDPVRAKVLLKEAAGRLRTNEEEELAQQLIEELG